MIEREEMIRIYEDNGYYVRNVSNNNNTDNARATTAEITILFIILIRIVMNMTVTSKVVMITSIVLTMLT